MMVGILAKLWGMGGKASVLILFVLVVRQFLKGYPKVYSYCLWILVGIGLLCPLSIPSPFGFPSVLPDTAEFLGNRQGIGAEALAAREDANGLVGSSDMFQETVPVLDIPASQGKAGAKTPPTPSGKQAVQGGSGLFLKLLGALYLAGAAVVFGCCLVQYLRVRRQTALAVCDGGNVWLCDAVQSPFVIGTCRPRILLPYGLSEPEKTHILLHERTHIRHHDPLARLVSLFCVCLHWWNPLVWLAARKMEQDMEMFCDESALRHVGLQERKAYAKTLLLCASQKSNFAIGPAFGESNTERRVENIMKKKKNNLIVLCGILLFVIFGAVAFMTSPKAEERESGEALVSFDRFALADGKMYMNFGDEELSDTRLALPVTTEYCAIYKNRLYYTTDYIDRTIDHVPGGQLTIYSCGLDGTDQKKMLEIPEIYIIADMELRDGYLYCSYSKTENGDAFTVVRVSVSGEERTECTLSGKYGGFFQFQGNRAYSRALADDREMVFYVHDLDTGESKEIYRCSGYFLEDYQIKDGNIVLLLCYDKKIKLLSVDEGGNVKEYGDFEGQFGRLLFGEAGYCSIGAAVYRLDEKQDVWLPLENLLPEHVQPYNILLVMEEGDDLYYIIGGEVPDDEWANTFLMQYNTKSGESKLLRQYYSP